MVTRYTISVRSCLLGDRCGDPLTQQVATKPHGKCAHGFEEAFKLICFNKQCFFKAPQNVKVAAESTTAVTVTFSPANDSSQVTRYRVTGKGKYCQVVVRSPKYSCSLTGLAAGELVPVEVVACSADGICSDPATGAGFTTPDGIHLSISTSL